MSFRRSDGPADRAESERLLDAARGGRRRAADPDPLVNLLAAAAAPANPGELSGEEQAIAAFRAARAGVPAPIPARLPRRRRFRAGAAAWAAGLAATATAGAAFAAVSLDQPEEPAPPPQSATPGSTGGGSRSQSAPTAGGPASPSGTGAPSTAGDGPGRPAGTEQLTGLCRAYLAKPAGQRARALETAAFADLVTVAGGVDRVDGLCQRLVPKSAPKPSPSVRATRSPGTDTVPTPTPAAPTGRPGIGG